MTIQEIHPPQLGQVLKSVSDPEIPVLSVLDMGVIRRVELKERLVEVDITPTYSGCPAMDTIAADLRKALATAGYESKIKLVLSPAWTTDWITLEGRKKLEEYGIAAPLGVGKDKSALLGKSGLVTCPQCGSQNTRLINRFGSTACKALFQCNDCLEPFDYFKCLK